MPFCPRKNLFTIKIRYVKTTRSYKLYNNKYSYITKVQKDSVITGDNVVLNKQRKSKQEEFGYHVCPVIKQAIIIICLMIVKYKKRYTNLLNYESIDLFFIEPLK